MYGKGGGPGRGVKSVRNVLLASGALLLIATPAAGQTGATSPAASNAGADGDQASADIPDILVTARRRTERLIDVPVAATAVGAAEIRQFNITNLANIKVAAPQISFDRGGTGSSTSISLRGVSSSSLDAGLEQSVLVDFDGMPTSRGRIVSDGLFDVETIDVLKGPQALFFGKNSPGGVVSIRSADPKSHVEGYVRGGYEFTQDLASLEAAVSLPITDNFGVRLAGFGSTSRGYIRNSDVLGIADPFRTARLPTYTGGTFDPAGKPLYGAEKKLAGRFTAKYDDGSFDATLKVLVSHFESDGIQNLAEIMGCGGGRTHPISSTAQDPYGDCAIDNRNSYGLPPQAVLDAWPEVARYNNGHPYSLNDTLLPTLTLNKSLGKVTLTSITSLLHYNFVNQGSGDRTAYAYFYSNNNEINTSFVQEVRAVSSFGGMFDFAAGGYYADDKRTFYNGTANPPAAPDPVTGGLHAFQLRADNRGHAFSAFGQVIFRPIEAVELAGGARYTTETKRLALQNIFVNAAFVASYKPVGTIVGGSRTEDNVSPEVTLTVHPTKDVMVYAAYKTGYLSGGFSNPGTVTPASTIATNTYGEETVQGFEGGTKFTILARTLTGSLIGYRYVYKGLQLTSNDSSVSPPVIRTQNAGNSLVQGVELELNYRPVQGLSLRGSASYNDAYYRTFVGAQCYASQTAAQGCVAGSQNLSGRDLSRAPDWILSAGAMYDFDIGGGYRMQLNADARRTSSYYVAVNLNPNALQRGFTLLNAGARFTLPDDRWSLAVIGRNLTNQRYATMGNDKAAGLGDVYATAGEPRAVVLQAETRF
ncbi:MAG: hypothetical protein JWN66_1259 [Sphingomonas bacterium]|nr:hypothetical protein [Sphingomonas bacterium]